MKAGTVDPSIENAGPDSWADRSRFFGGGNNGGNGNGDSGDHGRRPDSSELGTFNTDKTRIVTAFLLLVVLMTFGGLIGAYVVLATNGAAEWRPFDLPVQVWFSTGLILLSSATYELARKALFAEQYNRSRKLLIATTGLGAAFISSQLLVWLELVNRGFYLRGNPYAGFFYILTAVHAVHVAGGIVALGTILLRTWNETSSGEEMFYRRNLARAVGWYWHFMGALWIVLFTLLGFWK